ncbi:unnamed protein product [Caenorhabditis bovis]|uniref:Uncharacterized protein n=1 Tax=Caenorhabditis bovis TaxID=2654633 RepID=A0A8S1FE11_9PELO|nr:unnamed protein product [Caenorhabditis bovis]
MTRYLKFGPEQSYTADLKKIELLCKASKLKNYKVTQAVFNKLKKFNPDALLPKTEVHNGPETLRRGKRRAAEDIKMNGYLRDPARYYYPSLEEIQNSIDLVNNDEHPEVHEYDPSGDRIIPSVAVPCQLQKAKVL